MNAGSPTRTASSSPTTTIRWKAAKSASPKPTESCSSNASPSTCCCAKHAPREASWPTVSRFMFRVSGCRKLQTWNLKRETASGIPCAKHDASKDCEAYFVPDSDVSRFTNNEFCRFGVSATHTCCTPTGGSSGSTLTNLISLNEIRSPRGAAGEAGFTFHKQRIFLQRKSAESCELEREARCWLSPAVHRSPSVRSPGTCSSLVNLSQIWDSRKSGWTRPPRLDHLLP